MDSGRSQLQPPSVGPEVHSITGAAGAHSDDLDLRIRRYLISMGIRTVCVILALVVGWPFRWVFIAGAVLLPYIAVIMANVAGGRGRTAVPAVSAVPQAGLGGGSATSRPMTGETVSAQTYRSTGGSDGDPDDDLPLGTERPWTVTDLTGEDARIDLTKDRITGPADARDGGTPPDDSRHTGPTAQSGQTWTGTTVPGETVDPPTSSERLNHGSGERTA